MLLPSDDIDDIFLATNSSLDAAEPSKWDNDGALTTLEKYSLIERGIIFGLSTIWFLVVFILQLVRRKHHPLKARSLFLTIAQPIITIPFIYGMTLNFYVTPCPLQVYIKMVSTPLLFSWMFCRCFYLFSLFQITKVKERIARIAPKRPHKNSNSNSSSSSSNDKNNCDNQRKLSIKFPHRPRATSDVHNISIGITSAAINNSNNSSSSSSSSSSSTTESMTTASSEDCTPSSHSTMTASVTSVTTTTTTANTNRQSVSSVDSKKTMRQFHLWAFNNNAMLMIIMGFTFLVASAVCFVNIGLHAEANRESNGNGYPYWRAKKCISENWDSLVCITVEIIILLIAVAVIAYLIRNIRDGFNITREITIEIILCAICLVAYVIHVVLGIAVPPGRNFEAFFAASVWAILAVHIIVINSGLVPVIQSYRWQRRGADAIIWNKSEDMESSLDSMLKDAAMRKLFRAYCEKEFSLENYLFWKESTAWKSLTDKEEQRLRAKELYAQYIDMKGLLVLNITDELREKVSGQIERGEITPKLFDEVQHSALVVMCDTFSRFRHTKEYRKELEERRRQEQALEMAGMNVL